MAEATILGQSGAPDDPNERVVGPSKEMVLFDELPKSVRDALNYSSFKWIVGECWEDIFVYRMRPEDVVASLRKNDYEQRAQRPPHDFPRQDQWKSFGKLGAVR